jgi:predicted nucleic acid-binding protein
VYVLDTNAILSYTADEPAAVAALEPLCAANHPRYISTLTDLELCSHAAMTEEAARRLDAFLDAGHILPLTSQIARIAGDLRRAPAALQAFDSGIAATALFPRSQRITRNRRDFRAIDGWSLLAI